MSELFKPLIGLWPVFIFFIIVALFVAALKYLVSKAPKGKAGSSPLPYVRRPSILTRNEQPLYHYLMKTLSQRYVVFAKVRLVDIIDVASNTPDRQSHVNRILSKHVDFLLCDPKFLFPVAAVELNDSSHNRGDRQARDIFLREALAAADVKLIEIPSLHSFNPAELLAQLPPSK
jgi:hypothetical protein